MLSPGSDGRYLRAAFPLVPHICAGLLLIALLSVFFFRVTFQQRVLSPADLAFTAYPWAASTPDGYGGPSNPYQSDDAFLGYPRRWALYNGSGRAWWQDDYLSGQRNSFSVDFLGLDFYPPSWSYLLFSFPVANGIYHLSVLLVAGVSMYLLLWQLRLSWLASFYGAMLFMLNGHFIAWLGAASLPAILGVIPLMIFGFERYRERRQLLYLTIPAWCLAIQTYLGYAPGWLVSGTILASYGVVRNIPALARRQYREVAGQAAAYAATAAAGALLAGYSLAPSLVSAFGSEYQSSRELGLVHEPLENAWTYLFPFYWGDARFWFGPGGNYPEWVGYFGISTAPLAIVGLSTLRRHWLGWFALAVLVFSAAQVFAIPPLKDAAELPGLKQVAVGRWLFGLNLAASLLAALGMSALIQPGASRRSRLTLATVAIAVVVAGLAAAAVLSAVRSDTASWRFITEGRDLVPPPGDVLSQAKGAFTHFHRQIALLLAGGAVLAGGLLLNGRAPKLAAAALVLIAFLDIFSIGFKYNATVARANLYPETGGLAFLRQDTETFRVAPVSSDGARLLLPGYTGGLYGLRTITGYDHYRDDDYAEFLAPIRSENDVDVLDLYGYLMVGSHRQPLNRNVLSVLNVKYVLAPPSGLFFDAGGQPINEVVFGVFGTLRQGQSVPLPEGGADAIELLLATGGGKGPDSDVAIHLKRSPVDAQDVAVVTINGGDLADNSWYRIGIPEESRNEQALFVEVEAPEATREHPLFVWGREVSDGGQRFESSSPVPGSLTFRFLREPPPWLTRLYAGDDMTVYRVHTVLPRAWGVGAAEHLPSRAAAMERVADDGFSPAGAVALVGESDSGGEGQPAAGGTFRVSILEDEHDSMRLNVQFTSPGYVVISRRFDPGWQAEIDGSGAPVLRGDGILQAVAVPAGDHTVTLSFRPADYVWGARLSTAAGVFTLLAIVAYAAHTSGFRIRPPGRRRPEQAQISSDSTNS